MPKILGDSLADHRDQVRTRLFGAMRELIVERGYDAITLADIAAGAGVGRTAVYNHFPDKESVLLAWAHAETDDYLSRLRAAMADQTDPIERLTTYLRMQMTELAGHHARLAGIGTALSLEGRVAMREHVRPMLTMLREILQAAVDSGVARAQHLDSSVPMISAITAGRFTVGLAGEDLERAIAAATEFVLHGVGAP